MTALNKYALLVPCYNAVPYINNFINTLAQLKVPFNEIIFYDDGSTDATVSLLSAKGFRVIEGKVNKGPGYARNRLAEAATCDYIHFHDIDDEFNAGFLEMTEKKLSAAPADVVLGYADWIDPVSRAAIIKWRYSEDEIAEGPLAYFMSHPLGVINTVYKRSSFLQTGGFNEQIKCWEDTDLHIRMAAAGSVFRVIKEVMAYSLRHDHGISRDQALCWHCRLRFLERYLEAYRHLISRTIFETELEKVKNAFIRMRAYRYLGELIRMKKKYGLELKTRNISLLYGASRFLPKKLVDSIAASVSLLKTRPLTIGRNHD
ncbi:glycosyltransferase family 2 protein [Mucilaginibacter angelicae]|uniref:Glycosyltransferase family 2 protein n=1 Tax=Mucilaginibacter angelicae TaxID=869718 RepID=A0ABV6L554_9SPHI